MLGESMWGESGVGHGMGGWRYKCNYRKKELLRLS